ncbi:MAG TPA: trypsin-like peptidase domain-containing protein, partial [Actinomycetota bacterium]|nr:trypsin-like peptidase domain-containing protein [Actinomycetota bacterium]
MDEEKSGVTEEEAPYQGWGSEPGEAPEEIGPGPDAPGSGEFPTTPFTWNLPAPVKPKTQRRGGRFFAAMLAAAIVGAVSGGAVAYKIASDRGTGTTFAPALSGKAVSKPADGTIASIVENIRPSIVAVRSETVQRNLFFEAVPAEGAGTGIILDTSGRILTNAHVVENAQKIEVLLSDGRKVVATVLGRDPSSDIAVIKIDAPDLKPAPIGNSDDLHVGDGVIAVGHALALPGGPTVTEGIVSALDRSIEEPNGVLLEHLIQTDAAINPGNSGGALLDIAGNVIGMNTAIASSAQNIGFAIAITPARSVVDQLIRSGSVTRPLLGVNMVKVTPEVAKQYDLQVKEGALVVQVVKGSAAALVGIEPGDVIIEADG